MYSCSGLISLIDDESLDALSYNCDANDKVLQSNEINFSVLLIKGSGFYLIAILTRGLTFVKLIAA